MAVRIRLKRVGKIHAAQYRVVVVDSRKKRDGRVIEEVGYYDPQPNPSVIRIDSERAQYWLGVGAQPSDPVSYTHLRFHPDASMGDNGPMDAFVSFLQTPWAVVVALVLAVLIGLVIRVAVSSKRRSADDLRPADQPQVPVAEESPAPSDGAQDSPEQPRAGPEAVEEPAVEVEPTVEAAPSVERPEPVRGRMERLRERLASSGALGRAILGVLSRGQLSAADWEEIEESLLIADLGLEATDSLMEALKRRVAVESTTDEARIREILREELLALSLIHIYEQSLRDRYETLVDPRLNHQQSLEMAFQVAQYLAKGSSHVE